MQERDLQPLRDQVFGEPERDPVVGRRDAEDVRTRVGSTSPMPPWYTIPIGTRLVRDLPGGVDSRPLVEDRDRVRATARRTLATAAR